MTIAGFVINRVIIDTAVLVVLFLIIFKVVNYLLNKFYIKNNEIYWRYVGNVLRVVLVIIFLSLLGSQFSLTSQISVELFKSTSLIVAILGFAAQEVLKDVISGMVISISKPYNIGSRITITTLDVTGIVEDITLRHTVIKCFDNSRLIIPNSVINKDVLKNSDYDDSLIGNFLEILVSYESDIRLASDIIHSIVFSHPLVLDRQKDANCDKTCTVLVKELAENGIILKTTVWTKNVDDNFRACSDIRLSIKDAFDAAGIVIPYPCRTVTVVNSCKTTDVKCVQSDVRKEEQIRKNVE
jgi:small-conductance mechanosensitive channel